jgi:hypothetical protein
MAAGSHWLPLSTCVYTDRDHGRGVPKPLADNVQRGGVRVTHIVQPAFRRSSIAKRLAAAL